MSPTSKHGYRATGGPRPWSVAGVFLAALLVAWLFVLNSHTEGGLISVFQGTRDQQPAKRATLQTIHTQPEDATKSQPTALSPTPPPPSPPPPPPWWIMPHPFFDTIKQHTPVFPQASLWTKWSAVDCLREAFAKGIPQDMRVYSRRGEDGIIQSIFNCIGVTSKSYVEFGVDTGAECSTRWLREAHGFSGVLLDRANENNLINLHKEVIYAETISDLLYKHKVPYPEFDHLTIDVGYNTFHVAAAVLQGGWRPRVMMIEFNRNFLPHQSFTVVYGRSKEWKKKDCYFGASALAIQNLAEFYGYQVITVDALGNDLFFVHKSALGWWMPSAVHANTPKKDHPLYQIHPQLKEPCQQHTWVEVGTEALQEGWDQSRAEHKLLNHIDRKDHFRVFVSGEDETEHPSTDSVKQHVAPEVKMNTEFARYQDGSFTLHPYSSLHRYNMFLQNAEHGGIPLHTVVPTSTSTEQSKSKTEQQFSTTRRMK